MASSFKGKLKHNFQLLELCSWSDDFSQGRLKGNCPLGQALAALPKADLKDNCDDPNGVRSGLTSLNPNDKPS